MFGRVGILCGLVVFALGMSLWGGEESAEKETAAVKAQAECPVMGGKINKELFIDYEGKRIYVCCQGCVAEVKKDPAKYVKKLEDAGVTLDAAPVELCKKCGEIKGSEKCCKEGMEKCAKCGMNKAAPGCCKIPKDAKEPVMQCPKCKEIMGTDKCCMAKQPQDEKQAGEGAAKKTE